MKKELIKIDNIPSVIYGEPSKKVYLFVHGKLECKELAESFADIACERDYQVLSIDLPGYGERTNEIENFVPWNVVEELHKVMNYIRQRWTQVSLHATSFGAYCSLLAFQKENLHDVLFVSPVLNMAKLIQNLMLWSNVTEEALEKEKKIPTNFGETLDWQYYQYVKEHPIQSWDHPTQILYADNDHLVERNTVNAFVQKYQCGLTVLKDAEHWLHTPEQLAALENWRKENVI